MPRQSRLDAPGLLHHVMIRGIERKPIFADDQDRIALADRLARELSMSSSGVTRAVDRGRWMALESGYTSDDWAGSFQFHYGYLIPKTQQF